MQRSKFLVPLAYTIVAAVGTAHAAPSTPTSSSAAETPVPIARALAALQTEQSTAAQSAEQLQQQLKALLEERSKLKATRVPLRREVTRHLDSASKAQQRFDSSAQKKDAKPSAADLERAQSEYRAALDKGKALEQQAKQARAVEQQLADLVAKAREAETKAKAAAVQIAELDRRLAPALKASESRASSARSMASKARTQTGFASAAAFQAAKAKSDKAIAGIDVTLGTLTKKREQLAASQRALAASTAAPATPAASTAGSKPCDIKQVDWGNFAYPDAPLKNGVDATLSPKQIQDMAGGGYYKLSNVYYVDLEGDAAPEALVLVECPSCGPVSSTFGTLYGYKLGAGCAPQALGEVNANGFEGGKVSGRKFVFERTNVTATSPDNSGPSQDTERVECSVANGKMVEKAKSL